MPTRTAPNHPQSALRLVVSNRLDELQINPFEAARRGGLERSYINDILIGKKQSLRTDKIASLARALEIEPEQLILSQSTPSERRPVAAALEPVDTAFDRVVNWLAEHPRLTCLLVCAVALIPLMMDAPR